MDYSTTIPLNTTNATVAAVWDCSGKRSISSQELWVKIGEGGAPFIGKMSVPFILFFLMVVIYIDEVIFLVKNSIYWKRTVYEIWVLSLFPVLTAFSITGIFAPRTSGTARFASSFYFAVVLKKFFTYILHYYGGKQAMVEALRGVPYVPPNPFPCCFVLCCWRNHPMTVRRLNVLQGLVYQVLLMYPLIYLLQSILALEYYTMPNRAVILVSTILGLLGTLSSFTCLYGYTVLSKVSRFTLQNYNIRAKFITVQMVVAFNTVQGFTIRAVDTLGGLSCGFPYPDKANSYLLHNYILICEVFIISLCARWAFRRNEEGCEVQPVLLPGETFTSIKKDMESATTSEGTGSCDKDSIPTDDVSDDVQPYGGLHTNKAFESV